MTQPPNPPPPPEMDNKAPIEPASVPLMPATGEAHPVTYTAPYIPPDAAPLPGENMPVTTSAPQQQGINRGCLGCLGVIGAVALIILLLGMGAIAISIQAAGSVGAGISNAFNGAGNFVSGLFGGAPSTRIVTLPEIDRIKQLAQLATVRFNYANVVNSQIDMPSLLAGLYGESLVMVAVGHVDAGIDLDALTEDALIFDESTNTLTVYLPAPQLLDCFLNENQSYIVERTSGIFAAPSPTLDTSSRRYAVQQFRDKALEDGILTQAQTETETVLSEFLALFTTETSPQIKIEFAPPETAAPLPETCQ